MKFNIFLPVVLVMGVLTSCNQTDGKKNQQQNTETDNTLSGKWVRIGHSGPVSFDFKENGIIEGDFGNDLTIDIRSEYEMKGDTVVFRDEAGEMC
ncbi:MAG: hypothetical protein K9H15_13005, partial [Bacteroidales bacterium]|nr:hypothetical protein [Bacteroidales bacterium]